MADGMAGLQRMLAQLADETKPIAFSRLHILSDLCGAEVEQFLAAWDTLSVQRRRHLVRSLVELAERSFEVNFDAIFRRLLEDSDEIVRASAIDGLWEDESPALVGPFLALLCSDPSARVRATAARGLGRFVLAGELQQLTAAIQERIVAALLAALHLEGEDGQVRCRAIESAGYACTPEVIRALESAYDDGDEDMRRSAVVGMGRSCDHRWQSILLEELKSASPAMRYEAALACGELALPQAVPTLSRLIHDPDREVSEATIWALGQIGSKAAKEALLAAYGDADEDTQAALDDALAEQALLQGEADMLLYAMEDIDEDSFVEDDSPWQEEDEEPDDSDWDELEPDWP